MVKRIPNSEMGLFAHPLYHRTSVEITQAEFKSFSELLRLHSEGEIEASNCLMDILSVHGELLADMLSGTKNFTGCILKLEKDRHIFPQLKSTPAYKRRSKNREIENGRLLELHGYRENKTAAYAAVEEITGRGERGLYDDWQVYEAHEERLSKISRKFGLFGRLVPRNKHSKNAGLLDKRD